MTLYMAGILFLNKQSFLLIPSIHQMNFLPGPKQDRSKYSLMKEIARYVFLMSYFQHHCSSISDTCFSKHFTVTNYLFAKVCEETINFNQTKSSPL